MAYQKTSYSNATGNAPGALAASSAPPTSISGQIAAVQNEVEMFSMILGRVRNIADALNGAHPRAIEGVAEATPDEGLADQINRKRAQLRDLGNAIQSELDGIERAL